MKKIFFLSLMAIFSFPAIVYSASIGGTETQGQGRFGIGLDTSYILEKKLKFKSASGLTAGAEIKDVKIDKGYQAVLKTSYGILDNLDVYVKLGVADYTLEEDEY
ncbi:MAG: hypothetical protein AB7E08_01550, partial [Candidatus Omnitrophota bacterium]